MRYTLETENNKLKKGGTGVNTCYYARGWDGSRGVMSKDWVVKNIDYISNASVSGGKVYLVHDKFERAKRIILLDMLSQIKNRGFDAKQAYMAATYGRGLGKTTQLTAKSNVNQALDFIAHYDIDQSHLFMILLNQAIVGINKQGKVVWMMQKKDKLALSTKHIDGSVEVTHITQVMRYLG